MSAVALPTYLPTDIDSAILARLNYDLLLLVSRCLSYSNLPSYLPSFLRPYSEPAVTSVFRVHSLMKAEKHSFPREQVETFEWGAPSDITNKFWSYLSRSLITPSRKFGLVHAENCLLHSGKCYLLQVFHMLIYPQICCFFFFFYDKVSTYSCKKNKSLCGKDNESF